MKPKTIVLIILFILFLVFLIQNTQVVTLKFYFWEISMSQIILIPLSLLVGFVAGIVTVKVTGKARDKKKMTTAKNESEA